MLILSASGAMTGGFMNLQPDGRVITSDGHGTFLVKQGVGTIHLGGFQATDSDGDGLPDYWMAENFGKTTWDEGEEGADGDADEDGSNNRAEFIAGTKPKDADSVLRAAVHSTTTAMKISFQSVAGRNYRVEHSLDLKEWDTVLSGIAGDGLLKELDLPAIPGVTSSEQGFYRVVANR